MWQRYKKKQLYSYLYGAKLSRWQSLIARYELHRRIKKRERI